MFKSVQAFRGLAALSVVAYHLAANFGDDRYFGHPFMSWLTWRMNLGVDFFFVLSGFIIMVAHHRDIGRPDRLWRYVERRFTRLYPTYWIYMGTITLLVLIGFGTSARMPSSTSEWITTFCLVRFVDMMMPIPPAWTLFHELCFYTVFALMIAHRRIGVTFFII